MDLLTLLPIEDGNVTWEIDENHCYDILMVADAVGKVWSIPYYARGYGQDNHEFVNGGHFTTFIEWVKTGNRPENAHKLVDEHYDYYSNIVAMGLANKCLRYSKYRKAIYDAMKERLMARKNRVGEGDFEFVIKEFEDIFNKMNNSLVLSKEAAENLTRILEEYIFKAMPPFKFVGIYHWDGDLQFENKNFKAGKPFVDGFNIPKSAELINDEELAKYDFTDYNIVFCGDEEDEDEDWEDEE